MTGPWPEPIVREIVARCEAHPDRECCGFVVRRGGGLEVVEVANVAGLQPAATVAARDAFEMDPAELLAIHRRLSREGGRIVGVWHSHLDGTASLSARDRAEALAGGVEQVPGADYLVVALRAGRAVEVRNHRLRNGRFVEAPLGR